MRIVVGSGSSRDVREAELDRHVGILSEFIGRIEAGSVVLDLRCLEDKAAFIEQLPALSEQVRHPRGSEGPGPATGPLQSLDSRVRGNDDQRPDAEPFVPDP